MNKFRANLHPAFFYTTGEKEPPKERIPQREVMNETKDELTEFQVNIAGNIISEMSGKYANAEQLIADRERFIKRIKKDKPKESETLYTQVRSEKIGEGFKHLKEALRKDGYIKDDNDPKLDNVKEQYKKEVRSQYEKYVWSATDKKYEKERDSLFGRESENYPANKVYCKLTGAATIFDIKKTRVTTYDVNPTKPAEGKEQTDDSTKVNPTKPVEKSKEQTDDSRKNNAETLSPKTKEKIKFLAHDLPNYLWGVKDKTFLQKIGGLFPIVNWGVDAPSFEDKKGIEDFINATDKLNGDKGKNIELTLLEVFDNESSNIGDDKLIKALNDKGLKLDPKDLKYIKRAFDFYSPTQSMTAGKKDQHALYLSILQNVRKYGGFEGVMKAYKDDVDKYNERKKNEGKEYKKGQKLEGSNKDLRSFAEKIGVQDFTSATRLNEKKNDYFQNTAVVDILADINNDGTINFADKGLTKTGLQFKEIYNMVGEKIALDNLLKQAKTLNGTLETSLQIDDKDFTEQEIKKGNKNLILLLQSIISNPGQDLRTLMLYGPDASGRYNDVVKLSEDAKSKVPEAAKRLLKGKDIDLSDVKLEDGVTAAGSEGLHQAVAGALYTEYVRGVGLGGRISFDEWIKNVSLDGGIQVSDKGTSIGLNLAYNKTIDLGKGWSVTPGASIGFIPMFKFGEGFVNPNWSGSAGFELAKDWVSKHSEAHKIGLRLSYTEVSGISRVFSAFLGHEKDKAAGIEKDITKMKDQFKNQVITPLLNNIASNFSGEKPFDLTIEGNKTAVGKAVDKIVEDIKKSNKTKFNDKDIQRLKENTIRYLINYNKAPIYEEVVRDQIAEEMAKNYSYAWAEQRLNDIDGITYIAGERVGFSWVQLGSVGVGVLHAGLTFKTHSGDMSIDRALSGQKIEGQSGYVMDQKKINYFNEEFPVSPEAKLKLENGYVVIPQQAMKECDIRINPGMRGLMKKDKNGNILLSPETHINLPTTFSGGARKSLQVLVGGGDMSNAVRLDSILGDETWFTNGNIDTTKLPDREGIFTEEGLKRALDGIKQQVPDDKVLQSFNFNKETLSKLENGKKYKIILGKADNKVKIDNLVDVTKDPNAAPLRVEYKSQQKAPEMMNKNAQEIAREIYAEALKVSSNRLYLISHDINGNKKWESYVNFANAVKNKDYKKAKEIIVKMLPKMDDYINKSQGNNKVNFSAMIDDLEKITDEVELGQAILSINNIFARVSSVQGGTDEKYHFKKYERTKMSDRKIGEIIESRAGQIKDKISKSNLNDEVKKGYAGLIDFAENYRKNHLNKYEDTSRVGKTFNNAVGINLGNSINVENPLFNPEVYEGSIIEGNDLIFEGKEELRLHALEVMAKDKSLMGPVLSALGLPDDSEPTKITKTNDGRLSIDFKEKNVILNAEMKFGYFAQCVNHMILLDNISAEIPGEGASVNFGPGVMGDGLHTETIVGTAQRTAVVNGDGAGTIYREDLPEIQNDPVNTKGKYVDNGDLGDSTPNVNGNPTEETTDDTTNNKGKSGGGGGGRNSE